jgi:hypothetical protein
MARWASSDTYYNYNHLYLSLRLMLVEFEQLEWGKSTLKWINRQGARASDRPSTSDLIFQRLKGELEAQNREEDDVC